MTIKLRALSMAALFLIASGAAASANTVELTLTVPLKITLPRGSRIGPDGGLKPFDTNCVVGSRLGYATGAGAQGTIVGQGSTAVSGSQKLQNPDGTLLTNPTATVIITYDDGLSSTTVSKNVATSAKRVVVLVLGRMEDAQPEPRADLRSRQPALRASNAQRGMGRFAPERTSLVPCPRRKRGGAIINRR